MLDKSIPYHTVIMCMTKGTPMPSVPILPEGYMYSFYKPGDGTAWAALETSVDEFSTDEKAYEYFQNVYAPRSKMLAERMVFIVDGAGKRIATASAWISTTVEGNEFAQLHWVSVHPAYQRKGFGRAVVCKALSIFEKLGPSGPIWLSTQTWSYPAIQLYLSLGFCVHKSANMPRNLNDFKEASLTLAKVMHPKAYAKMMYTALSSDVAL